MGDHKAERRLPAAFTDLQLKVIQNLCRADSILADFMERMDQRCPVNQNQTALVASIAVTAAQIMAEREKARAQIAEAQAAAERRPGMDKIPDMPPAEKPNGAPVAEAPRA